MTILGLDCGSSSVKAGIVRDGRIIGSIARAAYPTHFDGPKVEVDPADLLNGIARAIADLGRAAKHVDAIGLSVMSPAWIAMDHNGKPLTRIVTHQDRRSIQIARDLEKRVGMRKFLRIAGNRPFPGGISITTLAWYAKHQPQIIRKADLIGHLNTFLHRQLTGCRVIDPSNASFTGLYETLKLGSWNKELCHAAGVTIAKLPQIIESDRIPGSITAQAAHRFGLTPGTPVMAGMIDTSAALMLFGPRVGQLLNVSGSTDVLSLCTDHPRPDEHLLTRAVGIGRLWLSVGTLAAAGSAITWARQQFFRDLSDAQYYSLVSKLSRDTTPNSVTFDPYLAGEPHQHRAEICFLRQPHSRYHPRRFAPRDRRCPRQRQRRPPPAPEIPRRKDPLNGFHQRRRRRALHKVLYRDWPGRWTFKSEQEASLRGLSRITPR